MNKTNLAIAPKSSQSSLNCKAEIERVADEITKVEKELSMLRLSKKLYSPKDIERKNKLGFLLKELRSLYCELKTASKFEVGVMVRNGNPTPGEVKGLYLIDSHPRIAVLYEGKAEVKHERPAQLTLVDDSYCQYIWTGEDYPKLIRRGDRKECVDLEVLAENYNSAINTRDTHIECEAKIEDIELYNRQAIWSKKQYQKITRVNFPEGIKVFAEKLIGTVLPYSKRNSAYLQQVKVKLDDGTVKQFCPVQISVYQETKLSSGEQTKIVQLSSKSTIQTILIADIRRNGGTQQRIRLNHETVEEYAEAMRQGDKFPPVKLRFDGKSYWLTDGFHTTEAAFSIGRIEIEADVTEGSQRDAILDSVGVNANHGLRRSNADKRRAVTTLLNDQEWKQWSDREIARRCKVSQPFVSKLRSHVTDNVISDNRRNYKDKHGNTSQMNTENIGSDNKQPVLRVEPENDNKSTDNQDSNCPDKSNTIQTNCPEKKRETIHNKSNTIGNKKLAEQFEVGQLVKVELANFHGASDEMKLANHRYGVISSLTENKTNFHVAVLDSKNFILSPEDIQPVKSVSFPVQFTPKQFVTLMSIYQTRSQIEDAIIKRVLN